LKTASSAIRSFFISILILTCAGKIAVSQDTGYVTDQDGNRYKTVRIGNQIWMAENLRTLKFNDGSDIPIVTDNRDWSILSTPACCWYNNDTTFKNKYGVLYNGYAVNTDKLCPAGWHISRDDEWNTLIQESGGDAAAGGNLKESGMENREQPNYGASGEKGFNALHGGSRFSSGLYITMGKMGYWWTFTGSNVYNGWYRSMSYSDSSISRNFNDFANGFSVRCVKD
jgi:uncharacterized protein (TIGR02145 family)